MRCCYRQDGFILAGRHLSDDYDNLGVHMRFAKGENHEKCDVDPFKWCCKLAALQKYCDMYFEKRPISTSKAYDGFHSGMVKNLLSLLRTTAIISVLSLLYVRKANFKVVK